MSVAQNVITAIVRLVGLGLAAYGLLGLVGVGVMGGRMAARGMPEFGAGMTGMAAGAALVTMGLGAVVFFLARPLARAVTFDMD